MNYYYNVPPSPPATTTKDRSIFAILGLVLGLVNILSWVFPICGFPLSIIGIILSVFGLKSSKRTLAIIGIVLSALAFLATTGNFVAG